MGKQGEKAFMNMAGSCEITDMFIITKGTNESCPRVCSGKIYSVILFSVYSNGLGNTLHRSLIGKLLYRCLEIALPNLGGDHNNLCQMVILALAVLLDDLRNAYVIFGEDLCHLSQHTASVLHMETKEIAVVSIFHFFHRK